MDEAVLRHVFEPFFTTRAAGSGLGLATARDIVREHDGVMNVWTKPGVGTSVEAWAPCIMEGVSEPSRPRLPVGQGQHCWLWTRITRNCSKAKKFWRPSVMNRSDLPAPARR
ncbi:ATP-binding protein [Methylocella silvestris]|uniref:ATP-binding protein n=1 Tax=Methylocella silvestris TaxID=199596 RepID=UPI003D7C1F8A